MTKHRLLLALCTVLAVTTGFSLLGCRGPIIRSVVVTPAATLGWSHPGVVYHLKRTRFDISTNLKIVRDVPTKKEGNNWVPIRDQATYRIDFLQPDTLTVTPGIEDNPKQAFAIHADSIDSMWVNIKNFEIKLSAAGSLQSVNGDFEDTSLKVAGNVVGITTDVMKYVAGASVKAAALAGTETETKIESTVLTAPLITAQLSAVLAEFAASGKDLTLDLKGMLIPRIKWAEAEIAAQNVALNNALRDAATKANEAKKPADRKRDPLTGLMYWPETVTIDQLPAKFTLKVTPERGVEASELLLGQTAAQIIAAVTNKNILDNDGAFKGLIYRTKDMGRLTAYVDTPKGTTLEIISKRITLPETGYLSYLPIDARLFTNRSAALTFGDDGQLTQYKIVATSSASALSQTLADQTQKVLLTQQAIQAQRETDATKAKTDADNEKNDAKTKLQNAATLQLRIADQEDQIATKERAVVAQERIIERRQETVNTAKGEMDRLQLEYMSAITANPAETSAQLLSRKATADTARTVYDTAVDSLYSARETQELNRQQLARLKVQLEIIRAGLTTTSAPTSASTIP